LVRLGRDVLVFDREPGAELDADLESSEKESGAERTATGEGVEETERGVAVGEVWAFRRAEHCLVDRATGTAQLPSPSALVRARAVRAVPTLGASSDGARSPVSLRAFLVPLPVAALMMRSEASLSSSVCVSSVSHSQTVIVWKPARLRSARRALSRATL